MSRQKLAILIFAAIIPALLLITVAPVTAAGSGCPCTIWPAGTTPANPTSNETSPVELGVKFKADTAGYVTGLRFYKAAANTGTHIGNLWKADGTLLSRATFTGETASGWQQVTFAQPVQVTPNANYVASYFAPQGNYSYNLGYFTAQGVDSGPLHALKDGVSGGNGVFKYGAGTAFPTGSYQASNYWVDVVFDTTPPAPTSPVLLVTTATNKYSSYYTEILHNEGYSFDTVQVENVSPALLAGYDVVILGETPLTAAQVTTLTNWVTAGGNLIAMRPDKQLATLAGLTDLGATLSNAYLTIATASGPGAGLTDQSIQFHGTADRYGLNGATSVAELLSNATTGTGSPAVALRGVGTGGGQVAVFTYDLAKSVVQTRQGNPAWAGQNREAVDSVVRSDDLFFGNATGDPQPDWVDLTKVAIPQADEQQRLLGNLITGMDLDRKPVPHFWYLPNGKKAAVVLTADDHATTDNGAQVISRMQRYLQQSPAGCSVALWQCVRSSHYFYLKQPMSASQLQSYAGQGFDLGIHFLVNGSALVNGYPSDTVSCGGYTATTVNTYLTQQLAVFATKYPTAAKPVSNRTHCIVWSDWDSQAKAEANNGIRIDANYYYWPGSWFQSNVGMMNGGGLPMRFAGTDGSLIDTYQAMTQMEDEGPGEQTYPFTIDTLLDNALGSKGYYGAFTANLHSDSSYPNTPGKSDAIVASAQARGVPLVSANQMLQWVDGRNDSRITNPSWSGSSLTFGVTVAGGAQNLLQTMLPVNSSNGPLQSISRGGTAVPYAVETIKGIAYARFAVATGTYLANYGADTTAPTVTALSPAAGATGVSPSTQIKATFSEAMNPATINSGTVALRDPAGTTVASTVTYDAGTNSAVLVPAQRLALGVTYTATVRGGGTDPRVKDLAGNALSADVSWSFSVRPTLTLWAANVTPAVPADSDPGPVELGVRFTSDVSGYITGIRFYKGPGNTGTHIGSLWSATGTRLASATFTGETASGWQQVTFAAPIPVTAGTAYVASYFAPAGHYAANSGFFSGAGQNTETLHAPPDSATAHNGVYAYGTSSLFPSSSWLSTNYWVDVVFQPAP